MAQGCLTIHSSHYRFVPSLEEPRSNRTHGLAATRIRSCNSAWIRRMSAFKLRSANERDAPIIWEILQGAIEQRRLEGSDQWQNGYPSEQTVRDDIARSVAYVLTENDAVIAYAAIILDGEPAYGTIGGKWLTDGRYAAVHRVARTRDVKSRGVATTFFRLIEDLCIELGVPSIRLDTNFDNLAMLKILDNLSYRYCGEIFYEGAPRRAYEKIMSRPTDA